MDCSTNRNRQTHAVVKKCENVKFLAEALHCSNIIKTSHLDDLVEQMVCSTKAQACMYKECDICNQKFVEMEIEDQNQEMSWKTVKEERIFKNGEKKRK